MTTLMQVASRLLLVWPIVNQHSAATAYTPFYASMLLAWSVTEVIRYSYFVFNLSGGSVPAWLTWLRYNTFYVLYPLGIGSECSLVWKASGIVVEDWQRYVLWAILGAYVPGAWVLYGHMIGQRRKVMRGKGVDRKRQ
jgi:very-long-chain (3R)-3-hydroxyacyl-CoA dehydratase